MMQNCLNETILYEQCGSPLLLYLNFMIELLANNSVGDNFFNVAI